MPARKELILAAALAACLVATPARAQVADMIVENAKIVRGARLDSTLVVAGERILAVGGAELVARHAGQGTRRIDAQGRTLIPGLIDSHIHAIRAGRTFSVEASFEGARSVPEAMARLAAAARETQDGWIVVAGGWTPQQFAERRRPTRAEIEAAAPGRRVYVQMFYRGVLLSRAGVAALDLPRDGLPPSAHEEMDDSGAPTGWIGGSPAAITALYDRLPKPGLETAIAGTRAFFATLARHGVTGVIDPGGHNLSPQDYDALFALRARGGLPLRVVFSICAPTPGRELGEYEAFTQFLPRGTGDDWLRFNGLGERVTWGFYNNSSPSPEQTRAFEEVAAWAAARGQTMTVHWNDDRSAGALLDVLERVNARTPLAPLRWSIAHLHDARPQTLARMKTLGIGWLTQNALHFAAPAFLRDMMRRDSSPPIIDALAMGLPTGGGTDANRVMSANPWVALRWLLDGRTVDGAPTRDAAQIPARAQALDLWTRGSAWFSFDEDRRGALEPGMLADFALLTADYWTIPIDEIDRVRSVLTVVGGRVAHEEERPR